MDPTKRGGVATLCSRCLDLRAQLCVCKARALHTHNEMCVRGIGAVATFQGFAEGNGIETGNYSGSKARALLEM